MTDDPFVTHRSLLFTVAYEMLGSAADAEDVVQETWLRWADVDRAEVRDPRAYLVRIVTRQALNRLRTLARRREDYVGEWLPEPLLTSPDVAEDVELAESVSIAMLTVLETLGPPSARSSCCARCSTCPTPTSLQRSTRRRPRPGRSPTGPGSTWPRGGRGYRSIVPSSSRWSTGSWRRCGPVICRCCSTCSHPTWCWSPTVAARWPLPASGGGQ
jgi:RNA polymerase sigma factor (sigma-70 family)